MVRQASRRDPALARRAMAGLEAYEQAPRPPARAERPELAREGSAALRDYGPGSGPGQAGAPIVLIPSLINPPDILDLDEETSLAGTLAAGGHRVLLLDWGPASARAKLDIAGHVEALLLPLLQAIGEPPAIIGYCLGGTMAMAAAGLTPARGLVTLAAPWHFGCYPQDSRLDLARLWKQSEAGAQRLGALPMEVLQAGFWALDPDRTVRKFAEFGELEPAGDQARRFVTLEDWANEGEPLPLPAARELFESLYRDDAPGSGKWAVGGRPVAERPAIPTLHLVAGDDRIVPAATAPDGNQRVVASGHVGMIVGRARAQLHAALDAFLDA